MRILITGSDGVIATELIKLLKNDDNLLMVLDKKSGFNLAFEKLDCIKEFDPEVVFHLAASFERPDESPGFLKINYEDNILATERLNQALSKCTSLCTYVFASSYLIYDIMAYSHTELKPTSVLTENTRVAPRNLCGAAKLYAEHNIDFLKRNIFPELNVVHARIFRVYGLGSKDFISRSARWKLAGVPVQLWNEDNSFDYIHARDVASALVALAEKGCNGIFNVGTGISTPIREVAELMGFKKVPVTNHDLFENSCADIRKINEATGWQPKIAIGEGIGEILAYEKACVDYISRA